MSQSQTSQFTDNYPSSIFENNSLDDLLFLPSDSIQPFNSDTSYGQYMPSSTSDVNVRLYVRKRGRNVLIVLVLD
jgi:hypothetical protein